MEKTDVIIIGAGAAGLMCAIEAGKRQRRVLVLDHANKPGKKILMSGGGRCNFTNYHIHPDCYLSHNRHFCKSALSRYTQWDFIDLVQKQQIPFHEKTQGQLFCDHKSKEIVDLLLWHCQENSVVIRLNTSVTLITQLADGTFNIKTNSTELHCQSLVIATGGLSIPTMGASPFGYKVAEQFGIKIWPTRAGLVPLTLHVADKERLSPLAGIAVESTVSNHRISFRDNILFTHRGLSGPAILQISTYWQPGEALTINLMPQQNIIDLLKTEQQLHPLKQLKSIMAEHLAKRVVDTFIPGDLAEKRLQSLTPQDYAALSQHIHCWQLCPNSTEGYRTAEVTLGGVDCAAISSKTLQANAVKGLYFIGEVLDVTGWLGGYNFQWAWASGWAAGQVV